jgi:hypothetical protein
MGKFDGLLPRSLRSLHIKASWGRHTWERVLAPNSPNMEFIQEQYVYNVVRFAGKGMVALKKNRTSLASNLHAVRLDLPAWMESHDEFPEIQRELLSGWDSVAFELTLKESLTSGL